MAKRAPASVLMTADTLGGVWTYALELARGLSSHGLRVELATMGAHPSRQQRMQALSISYLRVHESNYRLEWMDDPWNDVNRAGEWLLNIEHQVRPDVIHLNSYAHADLPWNSPRLVIGHSCVVSWWRYVKKAETPAEWNYYRERVSAGLDKAEVVVAPSQDMLSQLRMHYQWSGPARVIYNGRAPLLPTARK